MRSYFTKEQIESISQENLNKYNKYLRSSVLKNPDVRDTTYKTYETYFMQFLTYLAVEWDNIDLYCDRFLDEAVDIMEGYMSFLQQTLGNAKKTINSKVAAISSFYVWSLKRTFVPYHPFDKKLDRMKKADEDKRINSYFLTTEQVAVIQYVLANDKRFNIQDQVLFNLTYDSANRIGAISSLKLSQLDLDNMCFHNIREKEGYIVDVVFNRKTKAILEKYIKYREENNIDSDYLFISKRWDKWNQMTYAGLRKKFIRYGKIVGIEDFHPHCLRKSRINNIYSQTHDLQLASTFANHKSIDVTNTSYIKHSTNVEIRDKLASLEF